MLAVMAKELPHSCEPEPNCRGHLRELLSNALVEFEHPQAPSRRIIAGAPHFNIGINITPRGVSSMACFALLWAVPLIFTTWRNLSRVTPYARNLP